MGSLNYTLKLSSNKTYTIAVFAENSVGIGRAARIQWSSSGKELLLQDLSIHNCICMISLHLLVNVCQLWYHNTNTAVVKHNADSFTVTMVMLMLTLTHLYKMLHK